MTHGQRYAVAWLLAAVSVFASMDALAKVVTRNFPLGVAVWFRYVIPTVLVAGWLITKRGLRFAHTNSLPTQFIRGVCLVASTLCFWTALRHLPLVEAATVSFIGPSVLVVLSALLLGENPRRVHVWALALGFIGVWVVLRPGFANPGVGALAALGSAAFYSAYQIFTRKLSNTDDAMTLLFYASAVGAVVMIPFVPAQWQMPDAFQSLGILGLGVLGTFGHWCMIRAYETADAPTLAPFMYVQLLVSTFYGWLLFNTLPDGYTLLGMLIIIGSGLIVLHDMRRRGQAEPAPAAEPD